MIQLTHMKAEAGVCKNLDLKSHNTYRNKYCLEKEVD